MSKDTRRGQQEVVQELRWDPLLGEWVMVSNIREARPWRPSGCPFCPGSPETGTGWRVVVLENKYPMLTPNPPQPTSHNFYRTAPARGQCLVVVETPIHDIDDISDLDIEDIKTVIEEVVKLTEKYSRIDWALYLLYFRNKGAEIGVSLTHPHSQIYVTPFIPSRVARELENTRKYYRMHGRCLICDILKVEEEDSVRVLVRNGYWTAFIPFFAHWPFEVHVYPHRHVQLLTQLRDEEILSLASILKKILCGFKKLFNKPMPYVMVFHQAPLKGRYDYYHLHVEIYGMYRVSGRLKYAAGMEIGGGNFTYDSTPEYAASLLRHVIEKKC